MCRTLGCVPPAPAARATAEVADARAAQSQGEGGAAVVDPLAEPDHDGQLDSKSFEEAFGEMKANLIVLTNCGIESVHNVDAAALKPEVPKLSGKDTYCLLSTESHGLYLSHLGALAYLSLTRRYCSVYCSSVQV